MSRVRYRDFLARNSHPSDEDLVRFVSNEASPKAAEQMQKHLDGCWQCQARQEEFKQAIVDIVQNLNAYVGDLSSRSRVAKSRLEVELRRLALEKGHPAPFGQLLGMLESSFPSRFIVRQVAFVVACLLILLGIFPLTSTAPISAAEFLSRSMAAEQEMMHAVANPVIHGKFRVTRTNSHSGREQSMTWEVWDDTVHNRVSNRVEDEQGIGSPAGYHSANAKADFTETESSPLLSDLQQVFSANGMNASNPLSPAGFDHWRQSLGEKRDEVTATKLEGGVPGMAIRTTPLGIPSAGHILSAELVVRAADWHPVEQRLRLQELNATEDYDVQETAYQVVALASAPPGTFVESMVPAPRPPQVRIVPAVILPSAEQLEEAELSAKFALHRVDEFLRGQIQVEQDSSRQVTIKGLVGSEQRKAELASLLGSIPYTTVELRTTEEALNNLQASSPDASAVASAAPAAESDGEQVKRNQAWVQSQWDKYGKRFQGIDSHELDQKMVEISNQAITHTRAAGLQAWALRRLARDYPPQRVAGMNAWSKWLLEMMVEDHTRLLDEEMQELNSLVNPVLASFAGQGATRDESTPMNEPTVPPAPETVWQTRVAALFQDVNDINAQALGIFGNVALLPGSAEDAARDLLRKLPQFKGRAQDFEQQVSDEFRGMGDAPAVKSALAVLPRE